MPFARSISHPTRCLVAIVRAAVTRQVNYLRALPPLDPWKRW